jgi:hypothetical protein
MEGKPWKGIPGRFDLHDKQAVLEGRLGDERCIVLRLLGGQDVSFARSEGGRGFYVAWVGLPVCMLRALRSTGCRVAGVIRGQRWAF